MHHRERGIWKRGRTALRALGLALAFVLIATVSWADGEVTITHYFGGDLGRAGLEEIFGNFKAETGITVVDSPIGHEDFKAGILVRAAGGNLPTCSATGRGRGRSSWSTRAAWARSTTCGPSGAWTT